MTRLVRSFLLAGLLSSAAGCAAAGPIGALYTGVRMPRDLVTGETVNPGTTAITGEACAMSILGLIATGDYSIETALRTAIRNAGSAEGVTLKNVTVDNRVLSVFFGLYTNFCTRVTAQIAQ